MRLPLSLLLVAFLALLLPAQTTGLPGVRDFTLNGMGSGGTSPVAATLSPGLQTLSFDVQAAAGSSLVGALGPSSPGAQPFGSTTLDLSPPTIWIQPGVPFFPGLSLNVTTVPPSGQWNLSLAATIPSGTITTFQFAVLNPSFQFGFALTQAITLSGAQPALPHCTIDFDSSCPNTGNGQCGAFFQGGGGCFIAGLPGCYNTGFKAYRITPPSSPLTITLSGDLNTLDVFFARQTGTSAGTMTFLDAQGQPVGTPASAIGACGTTMPPRLSLSFPTPVRSISVVCSAGTAWIDTFEINP